MSYNLTHQTAFLIVLLVGILLSNQDGFADSPDSRIHPYLQQLMNSSEDADLIPVYIMLKDRLSLDDLRGMTRGLRQEDRRTEVVRILKSHAAQSQGRVLPYLEAKKSQGLIGPIENIWSINVIAFQTNTAVIKELARNFPEIEQIRYDRPITREEAEDDLGISKHNEENDLSVPAMLAPQQGLILINAPQVWAEGDSGQGVIVSNVDSGTDWDHPDLVNNIWNNLGEDVDGDSVTLEFNGSSWTFDPGDVNGVDDDGNGRVDDFIGWNFANNSNDPSPSVSSHGTQTAGIVAGDGTNGTQTGVAPRAKLMNLNIYNTNESAWWAAYQYAFENGAHITTSSYSAKWNFSPQPNYPMFRQMNDMELAAGVLHTNSTSNDGNSHGVPFNISAPGNSPGPWIHPDQTLVGGISSVVGCANVDAFSDVIASSSPYGPWAWEDYQINHPSYPYPMPAQYQDYPYETQPGSMGLIKPDVAAPGQNTTSTTPGGGYSSFGGTSSATPHTAGTAALILAANPDLTPEDISRILQTTAVEKGTPGKDNRYGAGRIDAYAAYQQAFAEAGTPSAPAGLTAYSDYSMPNSMNLTWDDPTNLINGDTLLSGYFTIFINRDGVLRDSVASGVESYLDNGLTDGVEYTYQIYAEVDSSEKQSDPAETSWIAGGSPIPNPPAELGISSQQDQVTLYWRNPNTNIDGTPMDDFAGLNVYQDNSLLMTLNRSSADSAKLDSVSFTPATSGALNWYLSAFDNENPTNESVFTDTVIIPLNFPILDNFSIQGAPNPVVWKNVNADINDRAVNVPSEPFSLNFNGMPAGGDTIESYPIDLGNAQGSGIVLSYLYQPQGSGNAPEPTDSLQIYFKNDSEEWTLVRGYPGSQLQDFQHEIIDIEAEPNGTSYLFSQFQIRIKSEGAVNPTLPNDDWFMDNIYLGLPAPAIAVSQDSIFFDSTLVGDSATISIDVQNIGVQSLTILQILGTDGIFSVDTTSFTVDAASAQSMNITFSPPSSGDFAGSIQLVSNDPVNDTLALYIEGTGKQVTSIAKGLAIPKIYAVSPNYPNPFNPSTTIKYQLPQLSDVKLTIYNILGQKVRTLLNQSVAAGYHSIIWDGRNDSGLQAASGIYIYRFQASALSEGTNDFLKTKKMILMK